MFGEHLKYYISAFLTSHFSSERLSTNLTSLTTVFTANNRSVVAWTIKNS